MSLDKHPYLQEFIQALNDEIKALELRGESEIRVTDGALSKIESGEYVYSFIPEEAVIATDDQPIEISIKGKRYKATLVGRLGNTVLVATSDNLGEKIISAILIISPIFLLRALISVIEQLPDLENYNFNFPDSVIGKKSLPAPSTGKIDSKVKISELNNYQAKATQTALGSKVSFIWGPPGTGKTTVIGKIVQQLLLNKQRVLVTSHTNIAVDTALKDILEGRSGAMNEIVQPSYEKGHILRYGIYQLADLEKYPLIFGPKIVEQNSEALTSRISEIGKTESALLEKNRGIEKELETVRLLEHLFNEEKKLKESLKELKIQLNSTKQNVDQKKERRFIVKRHLQKAEKNNWFTNLVQGVNVKNLLSKLEEIEKEISDLNQSFIELGHKKSKVQTDLKDVETELLSKGGVQAEKIDTRELVNRLQDNMDKLEELRAERRDLQNQIDNLSKLVLNSAKVVATTLTKCYLRSELLSQQFDVIIVDEISMAQIPYLFVAIGLGKKVVLVGDFLQLPPISQANTEIAKKWLGQNLYDYFGISSDFLKNKKLPKQVKLLNTQYRMHPDISGIVNHFVYKGKLKDDTGIKKEREERAHLAPFSGHIAFLDTENIYGYCRRKQGGSRYTLKNVFLDLYLASLIVKDYLKLQLKDRELEEEERINIVGVVSPYRAHANLISKLLSDMKVNLKGKNYKLAQFVEVNTIHKFQGNQRQVIVFDTTDDFPMFKPAGIVDDAEEGGEDVKLINVAVTRAKDKFILLGNKKFIDSKHSKSSLVKNIVPMLEEKSLLGFEDLYNSGESKKGRILLFKGIEVVTLAINQAEHKVQVVISNITEGPLKELEEHLIQATRKGISVEIYTQFPHLYDKEREVLAKEKIKALENQDVKLFMSTKLRDSFVFIDRKTIFSFYGKEGIWGVKISSAKGVSEIVRLLNLGGQQEAIPCPECIEKGRNGMVVLRHGRYGSFYGCSLYPRCRYIDRKRKDELESKKVEKLGSKCPKCGKPIRKKRGRYGSFYGCSGYPKCKYIVK